MKRNVIWIIILLGVCLLLSTAAAADTYTDRIGYIPDQQVYSGSRDTTYVQILQNHSSAIHGYQYRRIEATINGRRYNIPCLPVAIQDLDGDGNPELLFMEEAGSGSRGDRWIYSSNGRNTRCVLYIPGITRLDYDEMLGFRVYRCSDGGGTLVIEHYEYEKLWVLQFSMKGTDQYELACYLTVNGDYSGMGKDDYYRNGWGVSAGGYTSALDVLRNSRTRTISDYMRSDYSSYGLDSTWEQAVHSLGGQSSGRSEWGTWTEVPDQWYGFDGVYGLTIDKIATRTGPGTQYDEGGTYSVKGQYIKVLAKAWDTRNDIWWVKCVIPYHGEERILWTGYKRFDHSTLSLDDLPEEDNW